MQKIFHNILFICLCIFPAIGAEVSAGEFIGGVVDRALEIVNHEGMSDNEKRQKLSECINEYLDIDRITKAVFSPLGYRDLSADDKLKVKKFMKEYLLCFYAGEGKLSAMMNAKLSSKPAAEKKGNDNDFAVATQFVKNSSPSIKIVWVTDGSKVFYVEIEGFNQITTLRSEMKANIGLGTLMEYINKQLAK